MIYKFTNPRKLKITFDTASTDSASVANTTIAAHPSGGIIPSGAIITKVWYDVITTFTSATSAATIAIKAQGANDIISAIAINSGTTMWNAGQHGTLIGFPNFGADAAHDSQVEVAALFTGTYLKMTADREITFTVAIEALTAGKLNLFVEYTL